MFRLSNGLMIPAYIFTTTPPPPPPQKKPFPRVGIVKYVGESGMVVYFKVPRGVKETGLMEYIPKDKYESVHSLCNKGFKLCEYDDDDDEVSEDTAKEFYLQQSS